MVNARGAAIAAFADSQVRQGKLETPSKKEQGSHWPGELGDSSRAAGGILSMWLGPEEAEARERVARLGLPCLRGGMAE